jgi:hypothetical protein
MQCPRCHAENREGRRFCGECGLSFALPCPACSFLNEGSEKFCGGCGAPRIDAHPAPATKFGALASYTAEASRREDPQLSGRAGRRAEDRDGHVRRPQGLDGAARRPGSRGGPRVPRSGAGTDDGGRAPLRGHRQSGHGRRDHGPLRRAARARGSSGTGVLRRAEDAGQRRSLRGGPAPSPWRGRPDSRWIELRGGRGPLDRQ